MGSVRAMYDDLLYEAAWINVSQAAKRRARHDTPIWGPNLSMDDKESLMFYLGIYKILVTD